MFSGERDTRFAFLTHSKSLFDNRPGLFWESFPSPLPFLAGDCCAAPASDRLPAPAPRSGSDCLPHIFKHEYFSNLFLLQTLEVYLTMLLILSRLSSVLEAKVVYSTPKPWILQARTSPTSLAWLLQGCCCCLPAPSHHTRRRLMSEPPVALRTLLFFPHLLNSHGFLVSLLLNL